jgi:ADP-dependent NAD(P)H-hydrate dehydratase / NAD(P)H-hydrate epimerase
MSLPVYTSDQIRKWDQYTIKHEPIASIDLMERAASLFTKHLLATNLFSSATVVCGTGNNGGDGLVAARLLHERGITVNVFVLELPGNPSPDFATNLKRLPAAIPVQHLNNVAPLTIQSDLVIDAIFGSGLNREPSGWIGEFIDYLNNGCSIPIVAVDIPSGLFANDNRTNSLRHVIRAKQTISFQSPKMAFLFSRYAEFAGEVKIVDIGLSSGFNERPIAELILKEDIDLFERNPFSHKGNHGFLTIIGGFEGYFGAAVLCSKAAIRTGCGYVATACDPAALPVLLSALPECIFAGNPEQGLPPKTTAIAIGPGLGTSDRSLKLLQMVLHANLPMVIDADAINLLAANPHLIPELPADAVLTPHIGELERLIGKWQYPEELLEKQREFSMKHKVHILQKGAYSKLTNVHGGIDINSSGNAGMASAGMGDVLTGIIGSLLAQDYSPVKAAVTGMYIHGYAADLVKRNTGERGMIASDVIDMLPKALNSF